jgi:hypothetical protein
MEFINRRFKPLLETAKVPYTVDIARNFSQTEKVAGVVLR